MSMTGGIWKEKLIRIESRFSNLSTLVKGNNECFFHLFHPYMKMLIPILSKNHVTLIM